MQNFRKIIFFKKESLAHCNLFPTIKSSKCEKIQSQEEMKKNPEELKKEEECELGLRLACSDAKQEWNGNIIRVNVGNLKSTRSITVCKSILRYCI